MFHAVSVNPFLLLAYNLADEFEARLDSEFFSLWVHITSQHDL